MKFKQSINSILNKQMNRQDFLKHVAIGVVALSGAGTALRLLAPEEQKAKPVAAGYGGSAYGGDKEGKA